MNSVHKYTRIPIGYQEGTNCINHKITQQNKEKEERENTEMMVISRINRKLFRGTKKIKIWE